MKTRKHDIKTADLFECDIPYLKDIFDKSIYPWEILPQIKVITRKLISKGIKGYKQIGNDILVGKNVKIAKTATIIGPVIIGNDTEIRPGAYIRGDAIIGDSCVIGNSSEIKNSIILHKVVIPHFNYIGDSILGNNVHLTGGVLLANLKNDKQNVIIRGKKDYFTNLRKCGSFIGSNVQICPGCILNPGTIIGKNTIIYPLITLRGIYPANVIVKKTDSIITVNQKK